MKTIFVTVQGGVAEVVEETLPDGVTVEIIDYDNLFCDSEHFVNREAIKRLSAEAVKYLSREGDLRTYESRSEE